MEFGKRDFDLPDADVLILAGDICVASYLKESHCGTLVGNHAHEFFRDVSAKYRDVIYVAGNHEHYGGNLDKTSDIINDFFDRENIINIHHEHCGVVVIEDVLFIYATLWTDIDKRNPVVINRGKGYMSDYLEITYGIGEENTFMTPNYATILHDNYRDFISVYAECHDKVVVVTHHAPNLKSCTEQSYTNHFYACTDMDDIILDNPCISHWIHGHTHDNSDYMIGDTNVLSNCRGYFGYEDVSNFEIKVFDI